MKLLKQYSWIHPLELSKRISDEEKHWCLLYSGKNTGNVGNKSFLAMGLKEKIFANKISDFIDKTSTENNVFDNMWFGYLGYDLKNSIEDLPLENTSIIDMPNLLFMKFNNIIVFDHELNLINLYSENDSVINVFNDEFIKINDSSKSQSSINELKSNMTKNEYIDKVNYIIDEIKKGTLYQANLTRKFYGTLSNSGDHFDYFTKLCELSPSPYSCYFKIDDVHIISSSPEQFIKSDNKGNVTTMPIKGTAPRNDNEIIDAITLKKFSNSVKDKSENLMIVDLMRNDFSKGCKKSSISVEDLFKIDSYKSVHHMSSKIKGIIKNDVKPLEFIKNCFPPGSMTGTPKIKAMEICSDMEKISRGIYSGCIGWIGGDSSFDTSVVIRTLIIRDKLFEFQVGGAIVYDSEPEKEWLETVYKAKDICDTLNIPLEKLMSI